MNYIERTSTFNKYHFTSSLIENKNILIYGSNTEYYNKLISCLINNSLETHYFNDDFHEAFDKILKIKPAFALLSFIQNEDKIIDVIGAIREFSPGTHIIIQVPLKVLIFLQCENLNVSGIIAEEADSNELLKCLKMVLSGFRFLGKGVQPKKIIHRSGSPSITAQEQKIMALIGEGITRNQKIAEKLYLSPHTIKNHKNNIIKKLNLCNIQDLYFLARQNTFNNSVSEN